MTWENSAITIATFLPIAGALVIALVPREQDRVVRALGIVPVGLLDRAFRDPAVDALGRQTGRDRSATRPAGGELVLGELAREPLVVDQADGLQAFELPRDLVGIEPRPQEPHLELAP